MRSTVRFVFAGTFKPDQFCDFVDHRARVLDLEADVGDAGRHRIDVSVAGAADLIDAFEMACSLGPLGCLVIDITRTDVGSMPMETR